MTPTSPTLEELETALCFYIPCIPISEVRAVLRLYLHLQRNVKETVRIIGMQSDFYTAKDSIIAVLAGMDSRHENNQEKNPFIEARKQIEENSRKEKFAQSIGKDGWTKTQKFIQAFDGRIISITNGY